MLAALWEHATDRVSVSLNNWALRTFAPHVDRKLVEQLDNDVNAAFAIVAEALETSNVSLLKDLMDPLLYSLFQDNYAEFVRLHHYRLAIKDIKSKRVGMNVTWKFPPFGNEVPSGVSLWGGNGIVYSQPAPAKAFKDSRMRMMQAVGLNYALLRRQNIVASTPAGIGGIAQMPVPDRFGTPEHIKRRVLAHINHPLIGDIVSLVKYLLSMRRLGFDYVLRRGTIEFEVVYGFECTHNLSVLPMVEEMVDPKEEAAKSHEEKRRDAIAKRTKYPELQGVNAPHMMIFTASYPIHPDGQMNAPPTKWRISEIDGMRNLERYEVGNLLRLSTNSPDEIDKQHPALRIVSKDLFTKFGPKKEWYDELRRLKRVSDNHLRHGSLDDPLEIDKPLDALLKHVEDEKTKKRRTLLDEATKKKGELGGTSSSRLGNIFDLARESDSSPEKESPHRQEKRL